MRETTAAAAAPIPSANPSSVDEAEIARFSAMAEAWWDPNGKFKPLHRFNPARIGHIRDRLATRFARDATARRPFAGLSLVDVGCGGGLIAEPMARLGFDVVGVDASERNIGVARTHAAQSALAIDYRVATAEGLVAAGERFDAVLALEIVEHVADPGPFLHDCARLVRPGGMLVVATLNRTARSFALAIVGAEYVLRWLPRGTHDWRKFLRPSEVAAPLRDAGLVVEDVTGMAYNPLLDRWSTARDLAVNYVLTATRAS